MNLGEIMQRVASILGPKAPLQDVIPWVQEVQNEIERQANWRHMLVLNESISFTDGTAAQPTNFKEPLQLVVDGDEVHQLPLRAFLAQAEKTDELSGVKYFTVTDNDLRILQADTVDGALSYWRFSDDLERVSDSNFWTQNHPDVLIYGACLRGAIQGGVRISLQLLPYLFKQYDSALLQLRRLDSAVDIAASPQRIVGFGVV